MVADNSAASIEDFVRTNVKRGTTLLTDGHASYPGLTGYRHDLRVVRNMAGHIVLSRHRHACDAGHGRSPAPTASSVRKPDGPTQWDHLSAASHVVILYSPCIRYRPGMAAANASDADGCRGGSRDRPPRIHQAVAQTNLGQQRPDIACSYTDMRGFATLVVAERQMLGTVELYLSRVVTWWRGCRAAEPASCCLASSEPPC